MTLVASSDTLHRPGQPCASGGRRQAGRPRARGLFFARPIPSSWTKSLAAVFKFSSSCTPPRPCKDERHNLQPGGCTPRAGVTLQASRCRRPHRFQFCECQAKGRSTTPSHPALSPRKHHLQCAPGGVGWAKGAGQAHPVTLLPHPPGTRRQHPPGGSRSASQPPGTGGRDPLWPPLADSSRSWQLREQTLEQVLEQVLEQLQAVHGGTVGRVE